MRVYYTFFQPTDDIPQFYFRVVPLICIWMKDFAEICVLMIRVVSKTNE